eukprot:764685-Hanusia_phi.AAC.3
MSTMLVSGAAGNFECLKPRNFGGFQTSDPQTNLQTLPLVKPAPTMAWWRDGEAAAMGAQEATPEGDEAKGSSTSDILLLLGWRADFGMAMLGSGGEMSRQDVYDVFGVMVSSCELLFWLEAEGDEATRRREKIQTATMTLSSEGRTDTTDYCEEPLPMRRKALTFAVGAEKRGEKDSPKLSNGSVWSQSSSGL